MFGIVKILFIGIFGDYGADFDGLTLPSSITIEASCSFAPCEHKIVMSRFRYSHIFTFVEFVCSHHMKVWMRN